MSSLEHLQNKRFEIASPDEQPHEFLHGLRGAWDELYAENQPYLVGAALYGSSAKGRFKPRSDADVMVFADPHLSSGQTGNEMEDCINAAMSAAGFSNHPVHFDVSESSPDKKIIHLSKDIIDGFIVQAQKHYLEDIEFDPEDAKYFIGTKSIFGPFMMRFGQGRLQYFRGYILDSIEIYTQNQEQADGMWRAIADSLQRYEEARPRRNGEKAQIYLPQTLSEARRYYGLSSSDF